MEHATLPQRTILLNDPNPPALALLMAPLGALPLTAAYAIWTALGVAALAGAAVLLGRLADATQRMRLLPFAMLAPPSLIAKLAGLGGSVVASCTCTGSQLTSLQRLVAS